MVLANDMEAFSASYGSAFVMGLMTGMSYCTVGCAPFLSTYVMGTGRRIRDGIQFYGMFALGRVLTYTVLGVLTAWLGRSVIVNTEVVPRVVFCGLVMVALGVLLCLHRVNAGCRCAKTAGLREQMACHVTGNSHIHCFVAGVIFSTMPCPPLLGMLAYGLRSPSPLGSSVLVLLFGLGTVLSPLLVIAGLAGLFAQQIKRQVPHYAMLFQRVAGVIFIIMGGRLLVP